MGSDGRVQCTISGVSSTSYANGGAYYAKVDVVNGAVPYPINSIPIVTASYFVRAYPKAITPLDSSTFATIHSNTLGIYVWAASASDVSFSDSTSLAKYLRVIAYQSTAYYDMAAISSSRVAVSTASGANSGKIFVFDVSSSTTSTPLVTMSPVGVNAMVVVLPSTSGTSYLISGDEYAKLYLWNSGTGALIKEIKSNTGVHTMSIMSLAVFPNGYLGKFFS